MEDGKLLNSVKNNRKGEEAVNTRRKRWVNTCHKRTCEKVTGLTVKRGVVVGNRKVTAAAEAQIKEQVKEAMCGRTVTQR